MITLDLPKMMKLKKIDLIRLITKLAEERDILFDDTETLKEEIKVLEQENKDLSWDVRTDYENEEKLDEIKDILGLIKASKWKFDLGVMSESKEITRLTEKLENIFE